MIWADFLYVLKGLGVVAAIILLIKVINDLDEGWRRRQKPDLGRVRPRRAS